MATESRPVEGHDERREGHDEGLGPEFARLTAKAIGRAREEAEDLWADAQGLRDRPVLRSTATYGLAGLLRAGDAITARAREVAAQAAERQRSAPPRESTPQN